MAKSTKSVMINGDKARAMFLAIGIKTAKKWSDAELLSKCADLDEDDSSVDPGKFQKTYDRIVKANAAGAQLVLEGSDDEGDDEAPAKPAKAGKSKPAKADKAAKPAKAEKKSPRKAVNRNSSVERDVYGSAEGTGAFRMNALMMAAHAKGTGLTTQELIKKAKVTDAGVGSHIYKLDKLGVVTRTPDGRQTKYSLNPKGPEAAKAEKAKPAKKAKSKK